VAVDNSGGRLRRTADGYGQQRTEGGGSIAEGGSGVDGSKWQQQMKVNVGRFLRILYFCPGFAHGILFFCPWICPWFPPKQITNKKNPGRFARGQKKRIPSLQGLLHQQIPNP
jgi:hypothetical protein